MFQENCRPTAILLFCSVCAGANTNYERTPKGKDVNKMENLNKFEMTPGMMESIAGGKPDNSIKAMLRY